MNFRIRTIYLLAFALLSFFNQSFCQWTPVNSAVTGTLTAVHMKSDTGFAVGYPSTITKTTDGGNTWWQGTMGFGGNAQDVVLINGLTAYVCGENSAQGYILKTIDGGLLWQVQYTGLNGLYSLWFVDADTGYAAGAGGKILKTTNAGANWSALTTGSTAFLQDITFPHPDTGFAVGYNGAFMYTHNAGNSWTQNTVTGSPTFFKADFMSPSFGYICGSNSTGGHQFMKVTNKGASVSNVTGTAGLGSNLCFAMDFLDEFTGLVGGDLGTYRTLNGGNFYDVSNGGMVDSIFDIFLTEDTCAIAVGSFGRMYKTCNWGGCDTTAAPHTLSVCDGDSIVFNSPAGWSAIWTNTGGDTLPFIFWPDSMDTYYLELSSPICTVLDTFTVTFHYCDSLWPGDANANGIANIWDVLNIGIGFGSTGSVRTSATNNWIAQAAPNWAQNFNASVNYSYGDCNGDGTINFGDTIPLMLNYGLTHNKGNVAATGAATDPPLYFELQNDSAEVGDTVYVKIMLGDATVPASSVYGLAFSMNYDNALVDSGKIWVNYSNSWIGTFNSNLMGLNKDIYTQSKMDIGTVRNDQNSQNGMGEIATVGIVLIDNIAAKTFNTSKMLPLFFTDVQVVRKDGSEIRVNPLQDSLLVYDNSIGITPGKELENRIRIYPNPSKGTFNIQSQVEMLSISLFDLNGKEISKRVPDKFQAQMSSEQLKTGIYFLRIQTINGMLVRKVSILK